MKQIRAWEEEVLGAVVNLVVRTEVLVSVSRRLPDFVGQNDISSYLGYIKPAILPSNVVQKR